MAAMAPSRSERRNTTRVRILCKAVRVLANRANIRQATTIEMAARNGLSFWSGDLSVRSSHNRLYTVERANAPFTTTRRNASISRKR
jgi:hypothetical protein